MASSTTCPSRPSTWSAASRRPSSRARSWRRSERWVRKLATLSVHVVSPEREVYAGEADMIVARGTDGEVGILPGHAPMLIELAIAPVRVFDGTTEREKILVDGGFLHVTPGEDVTRVDVLAESAEMTSEVDAAAAKRRVEELRPGADGEDQRARATLARWEMRAEHGAA